MTLLDAPPTSHLRTGFRILLGAALVFAGISHLTYARDGFGAQVPDWFPIGDDIVVVVSGLVEISLGAALVLFGRGRIAVGLVAAVFFVVIFPGNLWQYLDHADGLGLDTDAERFRRLFFQPVLVLWALWSTGAWRDRPWANKNKNLF